MQKSSHKPAVSPQESAARESRNGRHASAAPRSQVDVFEAAIRAFHARKFREARQLFIEARNGPDRAMALNADLHVRMCDRRLEETSVVLNTAEEHYNYAVALINSRELTLARKHLHAALAQDPQADHVYYALALCLALAGDLQGAYENLRCAIDLQPRNRIAARQDADFAGLVNRPPLDRLVYPERKSST